MLFVRVYAHFSTEQAHHNNYMHEIICYPINELNGLLEKMSCVDVLSEFLMKCVYFWEFNSILVFLIGIKLQLILKNSYHKNGKKWFQSNTQKHVSGFIPDKNITFARMSIQNTIYLLNWFYITPIQIGFWWCDEPIAIQTVYYETFIIGIYPNLCNRCSHMECITLWANTSCLLVIHVTFVGL